MAARPDREVGGNNAGARVTHKLFRSPVREDCPDVATMALNRSAGNSAAVGNFSPAERFFYAPQPSENHQSSRDLK